MQDSSRSLPRVNNGTDSYHTPGNGQKAGGRGTPDQPLRPHRRYRRTLHLQRDGGSKPTTPPRARNPRLREAALHSRPPAPRPPPCRHPTDRQTDKHPEEHPIPPRRARRLTPLAMAHGCRCRCPGGRGRQSPRSPALRRRACVRARAPALPPPGAGRRRPGGC